jgi:hypothetical protein
MALHNERPKLPRSDFVSGAPVTTKRASSDDKPWAQHDPKAPPTKEIKVRLNDYQMALLRELSRREFSSMHATVMRLLVPEMVARIEAKDGG